MAWRTAAFVVAAAILLWRLYRRPSTWSHAGQIVAAFALVAVAVPDFDGVPTWDERVYWAALASLLFWGRFRERDPDEARAGPPSPPLSEVDSKRVERWQAVALVAVVAASIIVPFVWLLLDGRRWFLWFVLGVFVVVGAIGGIAGRIMWRLNPAASRAALRAVLPKPPKRKRRELDRHGFPLPDGSTGGRRP